MKLDGDDTVSQPNAIGGQVFTDKGTGVRVKCEDFMSILSKSEEPLVIFTAEGLFTKIYKYVTAYKGFVFFTESLNKLHFDSKIEIIHALSLSAKI
ncbi:MAG: hypothetical protein AAF378_09755 [Cyanobacteria bacterium P01_A01_bin.84]